MEIYDIITAAAVIAASYYTYKTTVPDEFKEKAARYAGIKKEEISEIGAMEAMVMRAHSRRANKDFFRRAKGLLTGRYIIEVPRADSFFSPLSLQQEQPDRQDYQCQHHDLP